MNTLKILFFGILGGLIMVTMLALAIIVRVLTLNRYCISGKVRNK